MSGVAWPSLRNDTICRIRDRSSTAARRFSRWAPVRCRLKSNLVLSFFRFRHKDCNEALAIDVNERIQEAIEVAHPRACNLLFDRAAFGVATAGGNCCERQQILSCSRAVRRRQTQKAAHYAAVRSRRNSRIASLASRHMSRSPFCAKRLSRVDNRVRNSSTSPPASTGSVLNKLPRFFEGCMHQLFNFVGDDSFHTTPSEPLAPICYRRLAKSLALKSHGAPP